MSQIWILKKIHKEYTLYQHGKLMLKMCQALVLLKGLDKLFYSRHLGNIL
jgi:hypothetical protein